MTQKLLRFVLLMAVVLVGAILVGYTGGVVADSGASHHETDGTAAQSLDSSLTLPAETTSASSADAVVQQGGDSGPSPADEVYVDDDGNAVLVYEETETGSGTAEFGLDVTEELAYALLTDDLEDEVDGTLSLMLNQSMLTGEGEFTAAKPDAIEEMSLTASGERSEDARTFGADLDLLLDSTNQQFVGFLAGTSFEGTMNTSVEQLTTSGEFNGPPLAPPAGDEPEVTGVSITENAQDGYTLEVEDQRYVPEANSGAWSTQAAAQATLESQFEPVAAALGGQAAVTITSYDYQAGSDSGAANADRLELEYTVEYTGVNSGLEAIIADSLGGSDSGLSQQQAQAIATSALQTDVNLIEISATMGATTTEASWDVDVGNYDEVVFAALDVAEENADGEAATDIAELRERLDAQRAVDLEQQTAMSFNVGSTGDGTVDLQAAFSTASANWGAYLDELDARGIAADRQTDTEMQVTAQTNGDEIVTEFNASLGVGQLVDAAMDSGGGTGVAPAGTSVDLAKMDVNFQGDSVTVEASAKFNDSAELADAIAEATGGLQMDHAYGQQSSGTSESYVYVDSFVGSDPTESEVRNQAAVGPETDVSLSSDLSQFPRLDTDKPRDHLGMDGDDDGESPISDYVDDETGKVETSNLRSAISDWRSGTIDIELLQEVISAWRSGEQVG